MKLKSKMGLLMVVISAVFLVTGCDLLATGEYNEGEYFGYDVDAGTTAAVYIGSNGKIKSIVLDQFQAKNCYTEDDENGNPETICLASSKRIIGLDDVTPGELPWYKQADYVAEKTITEQNLDWLEFRYMDEAGEIVETMPEGQTEEDMIYTDTIADISIEVESIHNAIESALEQAKE